MYKLRFLDQAEQDLISIAEYIAKESGSIEIAAKFIEKLISQCYFLAETPEQIGHPRPELVEGVRSFPERNYVIFFKYEGEYLTIVSIVERHRDLEFFFE